MPSPDNAMRTSAFRTSPQCEIVLFDRLGDHERAALADLRAQRDFYGILRRRDAADGSGPRSVRAVDRDMALLLLTLRDAGPLPSYVNESDPAFDGIRRLVLDGFVEISDGPEFVTGNRAAAVLLPGRSTDGARHRLAQLSWDAVEYGAALPLDDRGTLAMRLYAFNRLPLTAAHAARYPDAASILDPLVDDGRLRAEGWGVTHANGGHWINFGRQPRGRRAGLSAAPGGMSCKLYVSPAPSGLADAFRELLLALEAHDVRNFKVAGKAAGLLRPDKLVAYFDDQATLLAVGDRLADRLRGLPAQGVPFTAPIDGDGLLSWGADPPAAARPLSWLPQQSWRSWITESLAGALIDARRDPGDGATAPARFAVQRLQFEGVDVDRWAPMQTLWRDAALAGASITL